MHDEGEGAAPNRRRERVRVFWVFGCFYCGIMLLICLTKLEFMCGRNSKFDRLWFYSCEPLLAWRAPAPPHPGGRGGYSWFSTEAQL